ncbi:hypothetical protein C4564_02530 [Candidatus Microgenomates bacterium]|nr:MAG: hypothetical protein C4564_02530 [Candidatus Microgenomates bacterium]
MKKILKWGGIAFVILIILGALASAGGSEESNDGNSSNTSNTVQEVKEPTVVSATELADEFDSNQVAAEAKWKDQYVEFSAEITNITDSGLSFSKVASEDFSLAQISCKIKDKDQLLSLRNGQTVTVRGTVGTQTIGVIDVKNCEVVE